VLKAARSGTPATPSSFASLERSLDRTIEFLTKGETTAESKALLIEARRLRSVVLNWRSIPPAPDAHDEMLDRVLHLSTQAGAAVADAGPDSQKTEVDPGFPSFDATEVAPPSSGGDTEIVRLDFEPRLYSIDQRAEPAAPRAAMGAGAIPPRDAPAPGVDYPPYRPAADGQAYPPYPADPQAAYPQYPSAPQRPPYPSSPEPMAAYPPLAAYPPVPRKTPTTGRRAGYWSGEASPEAEPPVNDAPLAPETSVTIHPIKLPDKLDPQIVLLSDAYSDRADAYRALRRKLAAANNPRVIAVTSPDAGEGKTTCAINLALTMREGARGRVLLLEANVRAPSLAKVLGFEPPECFVEQLSRHREDPRLPWVAVEPLPQLHVMAVDSKIKHAPLLDPVAFSSGMERLKRAGYEYIVIDTPPVIGSFEVNMIADTVDGVLFAAITMKSRKSAIRKAIEQVAPAPILGVIVLDA
jgi:Mrp family chromosome partitioning ATPase